MTMTIPIIAAAANPTPNMVLVLLFRGAVKGRIAGNCTLVLSVDVCDMIGIKRYNDTKGLF